jgi:hypothetical protein
MLTFDLPFPYHMHNFDSRECILCSFKRLESQHRFYDFLYESMILLNNLLNPLLCKACIPENL